MITTPALGTRLALLLRLVARQGGEWTPARVARAYAAHGITAPKRTTHRADLKALYRLGALNLRQTEGRRYYIPTGVVA